MHRSPALLLSLTAVALLAGCSSPQPYSYRYAPGRTAIIVNGHAAAPRSAPPAVHAAIAAGNRIAGLPYRRGGGHRKENDTGYDCSGATSYVLRGAGQMATSMPSKGFRRYGERGPGKWISVYARRDHVFLVVAGLRFDTGWATDRRGPHWTMEPRPSDGSVVRHPPGL